MVVAPVTVSPVNEPNEVTLVCAAVDNVPVNVAPVLPIVAAFTVAACTVPLLVTPPAVILAVVVAPVTVSPVSDPRPVKLEFTTPDPNVVALRTLTLLI